MTDQPPLFHPTRAEGAAAERADLLALLDRHQVALDAVDAAIARIEAGEYGRCRACGERLSDERLDTDPTALDCGAVETCPQRRVAPTVEAAPVVAPDPTPSSVVAPGASQPSPQHDPVAEGPRPWEPPPA